MRGFVVLALVALLAFVPVVVCLAEETGTAEGVTEDLAAEEAEDVVDDWMATLPVHAGFVWNVDRKEWTQYINLTPLAYKVVTFEVGLEVNPNEKDGPAGGLLALTYNLGNMKDFGVDVSWAEYFGVNVGPFFRYDFTDGSWQKGVLFSVVDLSPIE